LTKLAEITALMSGKKIIGYTEQTGWKKKQNKTLKQWRINGKE
jgi:hypothetical protein